MPCFCTKLIRTCLKTANRSPIRARIPLPEIHSRQVVKKPGIRPNSRKTRSKTPSRFICPYSTTQNPDFPDRNRIKKDLGGLAKPPDSPEKHKSGPDKKHLYINQLVLHEIDPGCPKTANRSQLRARITSSLKRGFYLPVRCQWGSPIITDTFIILSPKCDTC